MYSVIESYITVHLTLVYDEVFGSNCSIYSGNLSIYRSVSVVHMIDQVTFMHLTALP